MKNSPLLSKAPKKILLITTRRIGDVFLTAPLIASLREAYPDAKIDMLVFKGTEGAVFANSALSRIVTVEEGAALPKQIKTVCRMFRKYDLALTTLTGDRPVFYARIAGKKSVGFVENGIKHFWKRLLLNRYELFDNDDTHTVIMNLSLLKHLGIEPVCQLAAVWTNADESAVRKLLPFDPAQKRYAVVHCYPMFPYKMWTFEGWKDIIFRLSDSLGLPVILTGGNAADERDYISDLHRETAGRSIDVAGKIRLGGVAFLLSKAAVYVGLDTAVTHMAAALGVPTVALYGPTNPVKWGPMPGNHVFPGKSPYRMKGSQVVKNVFLLQGYGDCVPCRKEGCERNIRSSSKCLQEIPADAVMQAVEERLAGNVKKMG